MERIPTRTQRYLRWARESALTLGAIAGVLCILATILALTMHIRPVVFLSGSMSPAIDTGALGFTRDVPPRDLAVGDIVTVTNDSGVHITHRITSMTLRGDTATLVLRGDANKVADENAYEVTHAGQMLFAVPKAGYAVDWLSSTAGVFLGGIVVGGALLLLFRRTPCHKMTAVGAVAVASVVTLGGGTITTTQAYWTDSATLTSGTFTRPAAPAATITFIDPRQGGSYATGNASGGWAKLCGANGGNGRVCVTATAAPATISSVTYKLERTDTSQCWNATTSDWVSGSNCSPIIMTPQTGAEPGRYNGGNIDRGKMGADHQFKLTVIATSGGIPTEESITFVTT